jgi:itaconyl-CoA hydratase
MSRYPSHVAIGENEYVETLGLEYDVLEPGMVIEHRPGFLASWAEARYRAALAGDHSPVVSDAAFAAAAGGGQAAIPESWIVSVLVAQTTRAFGRVVANLAWENVTFPHPLRDGDMLFAESEILGKRESKSRSEQGILHVATRGVTREGVEVCRYERKLLVYRSAQAPHKAAGYV